MVWYTFGIWPAWRLGSNLAKDLTSSSSGSGGSSGPTRVEATSTLRDRTPLPQPTPLEETEVIWGKPSSFSWGSTSRSFQGDPVVQGPRGGGSVTWPEDPVGEPEEDLSPLTYEWEELSRVERDVRINGPDGAYVDFKRIDELVWRLPDTPTGRQVYVHQVFRKFGDEA